MSNRTLYTMLTIGILTLIIYGLLVDNGKKFSKCIEHNFTDTVCDSCANIYTPYIIIFDDGTAIVNLK